MRLPENRLLSDKNLQIDSLDGLRGLAVLQVFLSHTSQNQFFLFPALDFAGIGKSGVYLFFILSSFLLTIPFIEKGRTCLNKAFFLNYFSRRFFRIYPLFFVYLGLSLLISIFLWRMIGANEPIGLPLLISFTDFLKHLALIEGEGVTWSILVEFRYYFLIPLIGIFYAVMLKNNFLWLCASTALLIIGCLLAWPEETTNLSPPRLAPYLSVFLLGSFSAAVYCKYKTSHLIDNHKLKNFVEILGVTALGLLTFMTPSVYKAITGININYDYFHREFLIHGALWSAVLFACLAGKGFIRRSLEIPPLRYLGFISFSVYFFHTIVIHTLKNFFPDTPLIAWMTLVCTLIVSHLSWVLIEKPSAKIQVIPKSQT